MTNEGKEYRLPHRIFSHSAWNHASNFIQYNFTKTSRRISVGKYEVPFFSRPVQWSGVDDEHGSSHGNILE